MKTRILHGISILGIGALLFGVSALVPAHADDWHRDRDNHRAYLDVHFDRGHVDADLLFRGDHDRYYYDRDDRDRNWDWDRDRDRDRRHDDRYDHDRDHRR